MISAHAFAANAQNQTQMQVQSDPAGTISAYIILAWFVGLIVFTFTSGHRPQPEPEPEPQSTMQDWNLIGIYNLHTPQTLTKPERDALDAAGGGGATFLYERIYPNGNVAWRYHVGDKTIYPRERSVKRRGLDLWGNAIEH